MREISPVLAGKFDAADYTPPVTNINIAAANNGADGNTAPASDVSSTSSTGYIDPRRYSKFDRTASQVQDAPDFSFGDFLDMVNPLQHIPVVSSIYRSITGDKINPVSRVAGDILYGGALGAISAVVGGASAIGDAVAESQTGHDTTGVVMAALFGDDKKEATTQVASADAPTPSVTQDANALAALTAPLAQQSVPKTADQNLTLASAGSSATASASVTSAPLATADAATPLMQAKAFPLTKQAYGGVMPPPMNIEDQNRIIALSQGSHAMRLGNTIYTNRLMNGPHPLPAATPQDATTATASAASSTNSTNNTTLPAIAAGMGNVAATPEMAAGKGATMTGQHNPLPQNLIDDMVMMKAIGQYKGVAAGPSSLGSSVDMSN